MSARLSTKVVAIFAVLELVLVTLGVPRIIWHCIWNHYLLLHWDIRARYPPLDIHVFLSLIDRVVGHGRMSEEQTDDVLNRHARYS